MTTHSFAPTPLVYVDCDVPAGLTLTEWRRRRCAPRPARPWSGLAARIAHPAQRDRKPTATA